MERIYGLLGRKLGHSWSPRIHDELGLPGYRLIEREEADIPALLSDPALGGINVTIPYKRTVMPFCDEIEPHARAIGAVNTIVRRGGKLCAFNTDFDGLTYLLKKAGITLSGRKVAILGSGGASLTAQAVAREQHAREVVVISRSGEDNYDNLYTRHADTEILINTTPVGMYPGNGLSPAELKRMPKLCGVADVVYNPMKTALLLEAEALGIPCGGGLSMLVAQAVRAEEHFLGKTIPEGETERVLALLRRELTNIVLIGMPGSGKSSVGAALAHLSGRETIDLDAEIIKKAGCSIPEIFKAQGETGFRAIEAECAAEAGRRSGCIIICGGGIVKTSANKNALRQNGRVYQLLRPLELLPTDGRPLSQGADLEKMWAERKPLYEAFRDAAIKNEGSIDEAAALILRDFDQSDESREKADFVLDNLRFR